MEKELLRYILFDYPKEDGAFAELLESEGKGLAVWDDIKEREFALHEFWERYQTLFQYFDDWVVVIPNEDMTKEEGFKVRKKGKKHIETIEW